MYSIKDSTKNRFFNNQQPNYKKRGRSRKSKFNRKTK